MTYSLAGFDERFGISKSDFVKQLEKAEAVWEQAAGKELFRRVEWRADMTVHLLYDERQETTKKLKKIDQTITGKQSSYDELREQYTTLGTKIEAQRGLYARRLSQIEELQKNYEKDVAYWNKRWGAPEKEYAALESQRKNINSRISTLNTTRATLNSMIDEYNTLANRINTIIADLQLNVEKYNTTRTTIGEEFSEWEYIRDRKGRRIHIYEFGDEIKLSRVLIHEFGHALGIDHISDPEAIMYRLNQGKSSSLSESDIAALRTVCKLSTRLAQ
jgi:chromosome segregation ATPase